MNRFVLQYRKLKRQLRGLRGYLELDRDGNKIVRRTDFTDCKRPVLMLCGFFSYRRIFEVLEARLRRDGYCVWSIDFGGLFNAFNTRAIELRGPVVRKKVERMYSRFNMGPLSIVGHSKGGLIGTYYVKRLGGDSRVRNLITLGTPHNGSSIAYLGCAAVGLVSRSVWQMTPRSPFIRKLKVGAIPRSVRVVSVSSTGDKVSGSACCRVEAGEADNIFNIEMPDVAHNELLLKRSVYEVIRRELALGYGEPLPEPKLRLLPQAQG